MKVSTRSMQHQVYISKGKWENSGITSHSNRCYGEVQFDKTETVKVIYNRFDRKVREAFEIQMHGCNSRQNGMNLDNGQYVSTKFWTPFFKYLRK